MALKDGTTSKNMLSRGLTSLVDSHKNKASLAAGPAAAAAATAAAAAAAGFHNVPLATPKHHANEGRNNIQKHAAPRLDVPSGSFWILLDSAIAAAGPAAAAAAAKNKASSAAGPAAAAGAGAASLQNTPFATPKHHATEGRNDLQKHAAPKNNIFAATANGGGAGVRCAAVAAILSVPATVLQLLLLVVMLVLASADATAAAAASADATAAAAAPAAGAAKLACLCFTSPAAAAPAAVVVRNKSQKYYSLARSPLRLPGSADIHVIFIKNPRANIYIYIIYYIYYIYYIYIYILYIYIYVHLHLHVLYACSSVRKNRTCAFCLVVPLQDVEPK